MTSSSGPVAQPLIRVYGWRALIALGMVVWCCLAALVGTAWMLVLMRGLRVEFFKSERRFYRSLLHRADGLQVEFQGGAYNKVGGGRELPHDLAHLIVEEELGLRRGVWGVLAAGGLFGHASVVAGRRPPHAARRSRQAIDAAGDEIMQAEMLTRLVCDVAAGQLPPDPQTLRRQIGERWWADSVTREALDRAGERLRAGAVAWSELAAGDAVQVAWRLPVG